MVASDLVSVARGVVIDVNEVSRDEALESGKDEFIWVATVNIASGVSRNDEVADLPRQSVGARNRKLCNAVIHSFHNIVVVNIKTDRNVNVKLGDNETWFGRNSLGNSRINGGKVSGHFVGFWYDVGHNGSKDKAVILKEESSEDDKEYDKSGDELTGAAGALNLTGGDAFIFHFFGGEISLGGFSIILAVVIFVIILPGGMIFFPFFVGSGGIDWRVLESGITIGLRGRLRNGGLVGVRACGGGVCS